MNRYKQREDSPPLPGAAYIRFSFEIQSDSFRLDAQLHQDPARQNTRYITPK